MGHPLSNDNFEATSCTVDLGSNGSSPPPSISLSYHPVLSLKSVTSPDVDSQVNMTPVRDSWSRVSDWNCRNYLRLCLLLTLAS
jgi:hypothetical protein